MNQQAKGSVQSSANGAEMSSHASCHDEDLPPPYSPGSSTGTYGVNFSEKTGAPLRMYPSNPSAPSTYQDPQIVTHVFVRPETPKENLFCGCCQLRTAVITTTAWKAAISLLAILAMIVLLTDEKWDSAFEVNPDASIAYRQIIALVVLEAIVLYGNVLGLFGAIKRHRCSLLICFIANIAVYLILLIAAAILGIDRFSIGSLIGMALEIYINYLIIRYFLELKAKKNHPIPAQELVQFTDQSVPMRPPIIRNV